MNILKISVGTSYQSPTGTARILGTNIDRKMFDNLARSLHFNIKKPDTTLLGYYYVNEEGEVLKSYPSTHKVDELVSL